nr:hypothetical protein [Tanacetum cinerariifolium]
MRRISAREERTKIKMMDSMSIEKWLTDSRRPSLNEVRTYWRELAFSKKQLSIEEPMNGGVIDVMKGLSECKASKSNIRRIQVKDIIKEVKDYLKTYSSAKMDISWYVEGIRRGSKESQRWQYSDYPINL